jgi:hypothetical protein
LEKSKTKSGAFCAKKRLNLQLPAKTNKKGRKHHAFSPFVWQDEWLLIPAVSFQHLHPKASNLFCEYYLLFNNLHL